MLSLLNKKIFLKIFLIGKKYATIALLALTACQSRSEMVNINFEQKFGADVSRINNQREAQRIANNPQLQQNADQKKWQDSTRMFGIESLESAEDAFIDTSKIKLPDPPPEFLPNLETLKQGQKRQLPPDMFTIRYPVRNFPQSYVKKLSFDDIAIPPIDAFGVRTDLGPKKYQLIDSESLQSDIDLTRKLVDSPQYRGALQQLIAEEKKKIWQKDVEKEEILEEDSDKKKTDEKEAGKKIKDKTAKNQNQKNEENIE
jgi:hypothetical protein